VPRNFKLCTPLGSLASHSLTDLSGVADGGRDAASQIARSGLCSFRADVRSTSDTKRRTAQIYNNGKPLRTYRT
jgi:hypothetical protein